MDCNTSDKTTTDVSFVRDLHEESQDEKIIVFEADDATEEQLVQKGTSTSEDEAFLLNGHSRLNLDLPASKATRLPIL